MKIYHVLRQEPYEPETHYGYYFKEEDAKAELKRVQEKNPRYQCEFDIEIIDVQ
jgi:hypothetical protein